MKSGFENLNYETYYHCWYEVNIKNQFLIVYINYKVIGGVAVQLNSKYCCFLKQQFSKNYLKLRKTGWVWTVQYIQFGFFLQICRVVDYLDPPVGIGLKYLSSKRMDVSFTCWTFADLEFSVEALRVFEYALTVVHTTSWVTHLLTLLTFLWFWTFLRTFC